MPRQFGRRIGKFRRMAPPPESVTSELRQSLQNLADCIHQTIKLLERSEGRSAEPAEERADSPRSNGPLIPNRRSQLLAKIDMRPPFRQQGS
jgi:hypothetical protein